MMDYSAASACQVCSNIKPSSSSLSTWWCRSTLSTWYLVLSTSDSTLQGGTGWTMLEHHFKSRQGFRDPLKVLFQCWTQKADFVFKIIIQDGKISLNKFWAWSLFRVKMRISLVSKAALAQIFKLLGLWHHHKHLVIEYSLRRAKNHCALNKIYFPKHKYQEGRKENAVCASALRQIVRKGRTRLLHHHSGLSRSHDSNLCAHKASVCSWRQCKQALCTVHTSTLPQTVSCLKRAPPGEERHYYGDLREVLLPRPARDELVNDDRGPMVHTCEQRRVLHVELALLLCRRLSWWRMGSTRWACNSNASTEASH